MTEDQQLILDTCLGIFQDTGLVLFHNKLKEVIESDYDPDKIDEFLVEYSNFIDFSTERKIKSVSFGDQSQYTLLRWFIISVGRRYDDDGAPLLILNEMPEDATLKDNPIKNVVLSYEDEDQRDRDYMKVRRLIS